MSKRKQERAIIKRAAIKTSNASPKKGVNYILIIAIDNYIHHPKLVNAVKDAEDILQVL